MHHRFIGLGVAKFFAREAFDGFRIVGQRVNFRLQFPGKLLLFLQLGVEPVQIRAHPLVLVDERQIGHADEYEDREHDEDDDDLRELAPNAEINFHVRSLTAHRRKVKAVFIVTAGKVDNALAG